MLSGVESLCTHFGIGPEERAVRLAMVGLSEDDRKNSVDLAECVHQHLDELSQAFYRHIMKHASFRAYLSGPAQVTRLTRTMRHYIETLGKDFEREEYFEGRLRIGFVHRRINLPLSIYQSAYAVLQQLILEVLPTGRVRQLGCYLVRITALDMMLAIDSYHWGAVENLTGKIDELRQREDEIREVANVDPLTGISNRRHILETLSAALDDRRETERVAAVMMVDLDHFKLVNDTYGHLVGDDVLRQVVQRLSRSLRENDRLGRLGGEEFVVLIGAGDGGPYQEIAARLCRDIGCSPIEVHSRELALPVTISVGATLSRKGDSCESLLERADRALYAAKRAGRNQVCVAENLDETEV